MTLLEKFTAARDKHLEANPRATREQALELMLLGARMALEHTERKMDWIDDSWPFELRIDDTRDELDGKEPSYKVAD